MNIDEQFDSKEHRVHIGLAEMLKGGVIMDVTNADEARVAQDAGAQAVMALERVPSDIRRDGGVARMSDPQMIEDIKATVSIPVMAKCRIGHISEARVLETLEIDFIDESEVLTPADEAHHINKWKFKVPFVCGCRSLSEALRRISEGAAMIRTKGEAGTGDVSHAVNHLRKINGQIRWLTTLDEDELFTAAKTLAAPLNLVRWVAKNGKLPTPNFAAGGVATPADAALCMELGAEAVFVGSGIFKAGENLKELAEKRKVQLAYARAIVQATARYKDYKVVAETSRGLGKAMPGIEAAAIPEEELLQVR
jgi:pyridoxal 5'-phosphate synthase pdxS subunit